MRKRDHHAPVLFLPLHCCLFPTKFRQTSSACSRLYVRFSHRADWSEGCTSGIPLRAGTAISTTCAQPSRAPLFRRRNVCRLQQRAAASAVCHCPSWRNMGTGPQLVLHSTMGAHASDAVRGPGANPVPLKQRSGFPSQ
jgi:hypothetical protein